MSAPGAEPDDVRTLHKLGYAQELARVLGGFSNFAISLSIICILAGGVTSFHVGFCSVGGAAIGIGWPLAGLFALCVAATMGQIASAFPTAGGLYHWAATLGGRGWGWATAWFNLAGLVAVLAAINVGTFRFVMGAFAPDVKPTAELQFVAIALITASHAVINHLGIRVTRVLTDFSGYWILFVAAVVTVALVAAAPGYDFSRLWTFTNFSGLPGEGAPVWPRTESLAWLFALGLLLPAYTITGFDASAHVSEETTDAARNVPRGIVRSVWVSALFGWLMLCAAVLAMRDPAAVAEKGDTAFVFTMADVLPQWFALVLCGGIGIAQYLCGLATVTSASRMAFAFARDGGVPLSRWVRYVSPRFRTPPVAVWLVATAAVLFTAYAEAYATIAAAAAVLLYISYVLPTALGARAYGRTWTQMGPWSLGRWFRPLAAVSVVGCVGLVVVGVQPPAEKALYAVGAMSLALLAGWALVARHTFPGPPQGLMSREQLDAIVAAETAVHEREEPKA
ncbi:amino acid permease [Gemmata sp. JC717]|uniref:amino acid permease n=1 Tax=Gemmata algarum TaxID=2975278 RepID=UPI0021BA9FDC|nr:amino acid permease [Gemmata algarum]MDY3554370.1 amino acid permease [Gemmata algarum]